MESLITDLIKRTQQSMNDAEKLKSLSEKELNWKPSPESWSILECIAHLNYYGDFYIPEIKQRIAQSPTKPESYFRSGLLGGYFAKMMLPKEKLNKMKTIKSTDPINSQLTPEVLDIFTNQQKQLLDLLDKSRNVSLNKIRVPISISKIIKLKLGDTFKVVIYHNQRHLLQAFKVLESIPIIK